MHFFDYDNMTRIPLIDDAVVLDAVTPARLDAMLATGWRHFGTQFFRYSLAVQDDALCRVLPLRVRVRDFAPTKSQRRVLKRNQDLRAAIRPAALDEVKAELFLRHRVRFKQNIPESLGSFLSHQPATIPCRNDEVCAYDGDRLVAVSFLDSGRESVSSVYAMFDPEASRRSLGILTALWELSYAARTDRRYYYLGYAYDVPSAYDYKKRFPALEVYDWSGNWHSFDEVTIQPMDW